MRKRFLLLLATVLVLIFVVACPNEPTYELTTVKNYSENELIDVFNSHQAIVLHSLELWDDHPDFAGNTISGDYNLDHDGGNFFANVSWNNFDFDEVEEGYTKSWLGIASKYIILKGSFQAYPFEEDGTYSLEATIRMESIFGIAIYEMKFQGTFDDEGVIDSIEFASINGRELDPDNYLAYFDD